MNNARPSNDELVDILFGDMKKMDSVIKRLTQEINDVRVHAPRQDDLREMDSHIKKLTREVNDLRNQLRQVHEERDRDSHREHR